MAALESSSSTEGIDDRIETFDHGDLRLHRQMMLQVVANSVNTARSDLGATLCSVSAERAEREEQSATPERARARRLPLGARCGASE